MRLTAGRPATAAAAASYLRVATLLLVALCIGAAPVQAQWPIGEGGFWAKLSWFHHQTTEQFRSTGRKLPFLNTDAESVSDALFVDLAVGITPKLDLWAQLPYFDLNFNDAADDRNSRGFGDLRVSARYNVAVLRNGSWPVSVRFTTKVPLVDFPIDAEVIPVGEGQFDHEVWLESGISLYPLPLYSVVWLGHRWRGLNQETTRDPGDEVAFLAEFGGTSLLGPVGVKLLADGIFGRAGRIQGIQLGPDDRRQILYLAPTLLLNISESTIIETGPRIPLLGRNYPAGAAYQVGLFHQGALWR